MAEERLQKILSKAGISSRRAAEKMITEGRVSVNRTVITVLGTKANPDRDEIRVDGKLVSLEAEKVYLMLHKPQGYVTTLNDPEGRSIVTDLLAGIEERVYPVGRLDYHSEGLLILTNDGEFAHRLQHPRYGIPKTYRVKVERPLRTAEMKAFERGIDLLDGRFVPVELRLEKTNRGSAWLRMVIVDGRNRVIRRAFEAIGHPVTRLIRVAIADVSLGDLREGAWRPLTPREVERLVTLAGRATDQKKLSKKLS